MRDPLSQKVKSSQGKASQYQFCCVRAARWVGCFGRSRASRAGLALSPSRARLLARSPVRASAAPGARGGRRAVRAISGTVTRWSLTTPRHTPHQKSAHHTHTAGKSTDETPNNILRKHSRQGPCFLSRQGPSAPPLPTLAPRATVSETRAIHARASHHCRNETCESSHVSHAPTPVNPPAHHRTRRLLAPASSSGSRGAGAYHQSLSAPPVPFCRQRLFPPQKPTR